MSRALPAGESDKCHACGRLFIVKALARLRNVGVALLRAWLGMAIAHQRGIFLGRPGPRNQAARPIGDGGGAGVINIEW